LKDETKFRIYKVDTFLRKLKNTKSFSIQQVSICGDPDKILCTRGKFVGLELKRDGGDLAALQAYRLKEIIDAGGLAFVARPESWDQVKTILTKLDKGEKLNGYEETHSQHEILRACKFRVSRSATENIGCEPRQCDGVQNPPDSKGSSESN
jgi:hypothetical protein